MAIRPAVSSPCQFYSGALLGFRSQLLAWPVALWVPAGATVCPGRAPCLLVFKGWEPPTGRFSGVWGTTGPTGV